MALTDPLQNKFRTVFANSLKESFDLESDDNYYVFFGRCLPWESEVTPPLVVDSVKDQFSAHRNSLFAIRLDSRNASLVVPRHNWKSDTLFAEYSDSADLHDVSNIANYYVLVDGSNVYKCISNDGGRQSTGKPTGTGTSIFTVVGSLGEAYQWKYLYTLTEDQKDFLTKEYLPISVAQKGGDSTEQLQYTVQRKAIDGELYKISVGNTAASSVDQYSLSTTEAFNILKTTSAGGNTLEFDPDDVTFSETNDAYNSYTLYIPSGNGPEVGTLKRITDYSVDSTSKQKIVTLGSTLENTLYGLNDIEGRRTKFKVLPEIEIHGDGTDALAILNVDSSRKAVGADIIRGGSNYTFAYATFPTGTGSNSGTGVSGPVPEASIEIGPKGGHGSDLINELDASNIMIRILNDNVEGQPQIINVNDFRQFGIIKNPILNDNSDRIAGSEYNKTFNLEIRKPAGLTGPKYLLDPPTFPAGDYVFGEESRSVAEILSWRVNTEQTTGTLRLANPTKKFVLPSVEHEDILISFGATGACGGLPGPSGDFTLYERVNQYNSVIGQTAEGTVRGWDSANRELIVRLAATSGAGAIPFSSGSLHPVRNITGLTYATAYGGLSGNYEGLVDAGGEKICTFGLTTGTFTTMSNDPRIGRIVSGTNTFLTGLTASPKPIYRMTTELIVSPVTGTLNTGTFSLDSRVSQFVNRKRSIADVASWNVAEGGASGSLLLTNVIGGFTTGMGITASGYTTGTGITSPTGYFNVDTVRDPDVVKGSGQVLYIQNVRPVTRKIGQREEFRVRIGF